MRPSKLVGGAGRQIPWLKRGEVMGRCARKRKPQGLMPYRREKPLVRAWVPVPQTDTGGLVE